MPKPLNTTEIGRIGEEFVLSHLKDLFPWLIVFFDYTAMKFNGEGCDIFIKSLSPRKDVPENTRIIEQENEIKPDLLVLSGFIEVKTRRLNQYLTRNDREENHNHFFGFELWKDNQRSKFGCLHQMFFPEEHDGKTAQPLAFVQILIDGDMRPFACISFDKFDSLKKRLIELAKPSMNLETWENIPLGDLNYCPEEKKVMSNMWYIPFEDVCDVATVKMIDGDPVIHDFNNCSHELVTERLNLLKRCATLPDGSLDRLSNKELDDPNQEHMLTALLKSEDISLPDGLKLNH